jgi:hypothetical protein
MHKKERVIGPIVEGALGLIVAVPTSFDTDRFGTFSREIKRTGSQLEAAHAKIAAAFQLDPSAAVAIASEGSFGPHPSVPFIPIGREIIVLKDRESGLDLIGKYTDFRANFQQEMVTTIDRAHAFAERVGFPAHGVIVLGVANGTPTSQRNLWKDIETLDQLSAAVSDALLLSGAAHIETDMRAHRNPTRMRAIKHAAIDLVRGYRSECPVCQRPGYVVSEWKYGLPCALCGEVTDVLRAEITHCIGCGHCVEHPVSATRADPAFCQYCNP